MSATQDRVAAASDRRDAPLEMNPADFRAAGHALVDRIADLLGSIQAAPEVARTILRQAQLAAAQGRSADAIDVVTRAREAFASLGMTGYEALAKALESGLS